jgi:pyrroline-5-carboxylate reductase
MSTVVFLGGGRITSAMLAGLRLSKSNHRLVVHDHNAAKLRALKKSYRAVAEPDLDRAVSQADLLIIAVRPDSLRQLLRGIAVVQKPILAVSLVAGVPLKRLNGSLKGPVRWVRAMPSPVCRSGHGLIAVTFPRGASPRDRKRVIEFFIALGQVVEIPESKFDAFTVTYSSTHGYHALAALAEGAREIGLDHKTALLASSHALADGITAWRDGRDSLDSLLEEAATPGGIAAATMTAMDSAGYARAVRKGLRAGLRRARANARK